MKVIIPVKENLIDPINIKLCCNLAIKYKEIQFSKVKSFGYGSFVKETNEIYFRDTKCNDDKIIKSINQHSTHKLLVKDYQTIIYTGDIYPLHIASHNLFTFYDEISNNILAIGGQSYNKTHFERFQSNGDQLLTPTDHLITKNKLMLKNPVIYNPNIPCNYFANGLHLFKLTNNKFEVINNQLPIISGIHNGRQDSHYAKHNFNFNNINLNSNIGLTVYDSIGSIIYVNGGYILYHRANLSAGLRHIQYATSNNLIHWSEWNLINFQEFDFQTSNCYNPNFFFIDKCNLIWGIIPYYTKKCKNTTTMNDSGKYLLVYSLNGIDWTTIGTLAPSICHQDLWVSGPPFISSNGFTFFMFKNNKLDLYIVPTWRMCYITNTKPTVAQFRIPVNLFNHSILLNIVIEKDGWLIAELIDSTEKIVEKLEIEGEINSYGYKLNFKHTQNNLKLQIKFLNANIYSIIKNKTIDQDPS